MGTRQSQKSARKSVAVAEKCGKSHVDSITESSTHMIAFENKVSALTNQGRMHELHGLFLIDYSQMKICPQDEFSTY